MSEKKKININDVKEGLGKAKDVAAGGINKAATGLSQAGSKAVGAVVQAVDQNDNGQIDIEDVIILGLKTPGVKIIRADFLKKELKNKYSDEVVREAIKLNPARAGIAVEEIDKIADDVIELERRNVSGISAALGLPGGIAMAATIPTDIAQYYGFMLRAMQELMYLYGWPELGIDGKVSIDSGTTNVITLCLGAMYGVNGTVSAIKALSNGLAKGVEKKLLNAALTKGTIYPIIKSTLKWFSININKKIFAAFFKKAIPVAGGVVSGGITYLSFKPCCERLKDSLRDTLLSNPDSETAEDVEANLVIDAKIEEWKYIGCY